MNEENCENASVSMNRIYLTKAGQYTHVRIQQSFTLLGCAKLSNIYDIPV